MSRPMTQTTRSRTPSATLRTSRMAVWSLVLSIINLAGGGGAGGY